MVGTNHLLNTVHEWLSIVDSVAFSEWTWTTYCYHGYEHTAQSTELQLGFHQHDSKMETLPWTSWTFACYRTILWPGGKTKSGNAIKLDDRQRSKDIQWATGVPWCSIISDVSCSSKDSVSCPVKGHKLSCLISCICLYPTKPNHFWWSANNWTLSSTER